ncbi:uncharacterized protein LOC143913103 [Arctopsyche grandis]|uniref:uncharacterized protein LOC143913103 n=1 Tax=Arctopsyche grandis TaxID=121162 RepID=UPI00406D91D1
MNTFLQYSKVAIVIHKGYVKELEYRKMPKIFTLDPYEECFSKPGGIYCVIDVYLQVKTPNDLWYQIKNISSDTMKHYRHDILHKGICVTDRCKIPDYSTLYAMNITDLKQMIEIILSECIAEELEEKYQLEGKASLRYCDNEVYTRALNATDWVYIAIILGILIMSGIGTVYHVWCKKREVKTALVNAIFCLFLALLTPPYISMILVELHCVDHYPKRTLALHLRADGSLAYQIQGSQFLTNLSLFIQFYFCISSFLMAYNFLTRVENNQIKSIWAYFRLVLERWLRLTPVYAVVLGFLCTIYDYMGSGPLWRDNIVAEAEMCRILWWTHLIYLNNYVDYSIVCYDVSWYLAADMQLFCCGTLVMMIVWKFPSISKYLFGLLITVGIIVPGLQTYMYNYYPIIPPDTDGGLFLNDDYVYDPIISGVYVSLHRPVFAFFAMTFILGAIHKCYNISRGFLEWDGFQLFSKFSYCVYVIHYMVQRYSSGFFYQPYHIAFYNFVLLSSFVISLL